jgi:hypothetical protein
MVERSVTGALRAAKSGRHFRQVEAQPAEPGGGVAGRVYGRGRGTTLYSSVSILFLLGGSCLRYHPILRQLLRLLTDGEYCHSARGCSLIAMPTRTTPTTANACVRSDRNLMPDTTDSPILRFLLTAPLCCSEHSVRIGLTPKLSHMIELRVMLHYVVGPAHRHCSAASRRPSKSHPRDGIRRNRRSSVGIMLLISLRNLLRTLKRETGGAIVALWWRVGIPSAPTLGSAAQALAAGLAGLSQIRGGRGQAEGLQRPVK